MADKYKLEIDWLDIGVIEDMRHGRNTLINLAERSRDTYLIAARQYKDFLQDRGLKVNKDSIKVFFDAHRNWSETTKNLYRLAILKVILYQPGIAEDSYKTGAWRAMFNRDIPRIKNINQAVKEGKYLSEDQVGLLVGKASKRIGLMIDFAFQTGCRVSELINVKMSDVKIDGDTYDIKIVGKGSKQGNVYASLRLIKDIFKSFKGVNYLFETIEQKQFDRHYIWREMRRVGRRCGIELYPHKLRHSCAMHLLKKKKPIDYIQRYLRHSKASTTIGFYCHHQPDKKVNKCFKRR